MAILITGSSGLLGGRLAESLSKKYTIKTSKSREFYKYITSNLDCLIHSASPNYQECKDRKIVDEYISQTQRMLDQCHSTNIKKVFFLSSTQVYKNVSNKILTEDLEIELSECDEYQSLKLAIEKLFTDFSVDNSRDVITLRISNGYGYPVDSRANCWHLLVMNICKQIVEKGKVQLRSNGEKFLDFIPVNTICDIFNNLIDSELKIDSGIYNLTTNNPMKIRDFITMITQIIEKKISKRVIIEFNQFNKDTSNEIYYSNTKLNKLKLMPVVNHKDELSNLIDYCFSNFTAS